MEPAVGVVVLTMGNRADGLARCLDSVLAQDVPVDVLVVGNGYEPTGLDPRVRTLALADNVGIPAGRNAGAAEVRGDLLFFFDDDAWLPSPTLLADVVAQFAARPRLGALSVRIEGDAGETMRRWVPRARTGDPARPGPAFTLAEGVSFVRRTAFEEAGGWFGDYFLGHEGVELTWRLRDAGWEVHYAGELVARHPTTVPSRHELFFRLNGRNRVWLARRNLPAPMLVAYLTVWSLLTSARLARDPSSLRTWWRGFLEGWRTPCGERRPIRWKTVWKLARLGQPPVI